MEEPRVGPVEAEPEQQSEVAVAEEPFPPQAADADESGQWWAEVAAALPLSGMAHALALHCQWLERNGDRVRLRIGPGHDHLLNRSMSQRLEAALSEHMGQKLELELEVAEVSAPTPADIMAAQDARRRRDAEESIHSDPNISALRDAFDAELLPDSIEPLN
ncbi:hypothetical protein H0Z60_04715 [Ectothiorhodospiraceae bacterium WFHF3C12]|nr:hypothetical protein [Ectothiorhodospiraceae bacterium WFHF3C12]